MLFLAGHAAATCPVGDLSRDCQVDFEDLKVFAEQWLDPNCVGPGCADLDMVDGVNMFDFALLTRHWAKTGVPLVINEFMASNARFLPDPQGEYEDWLELYNGGEEPIDVGGMYLTDDLEQPQMWRIPDDIPYTTTIPAHGYIWIWVDNDVGDYGLHAGFELDAQGEEIGLFDADGATLLDSVEFGKQTADISYGRYPDGSDDWRFLGLPSPRAQNNGAYLGEVEAPKFSHKAGFYTLNPRFDPPLPVTIATDTEGATIYYTIDGAEPGKPSAQFPTSAVYTSPVSVSITTCLRAKAVKAGWKPSAVTTRSYLMNQGLGIRSLPAVSLVGDRSQTFYDPNGIMMYPTMRGMAFERPVSFEYIKPYDSNGFQVDCGIRVHGSDWMRPRYTFCPGPGAWEGNCKYSFRLYFRGMYGESWLKYSLFPFEVDEFKSIVLRGGHNDQVNPFLKDELIRRLYKDMGNVSSGGTMSTLFINGEYRGYYNPCEHMKEEFCQKWYKSDKDWDVMTMNGVRDGDSVAWNSVMNYVRNADLSNSAYYNYVASKVDLAAFADYLILQLWNGNWDWPQNNWAAAAERSDEGKWRFFIWDAEGAMFSDRLYTVYFDRLNTQDNANGWLYRSLKSNKGFRQLFADRIYKHFYNDGALTENNIRKRFFELRNQLLGLISNMDTYVLDTWVPLRFDIFMNACLQEDVFTFVGPKFNINGVYQHGGVISRGDRLGIVDSGNPGIIYYTIDGEDPRQPETQPPDAGTTLVKENATKKVLVPTGPVDNWAGAMPFDDSGWATCSGDPGGVGYDIYDDYNYLFSLNVRDQMSGVNSSCYIRVPFTFYGNAGEFESLTLSVRYDDGFVAYINGIEVERRNYSRATTWNSAADAGNSDGAAVNLEAFNISDHLDTLRVGQNILAIHGLNLSAGNSDFLISAELTASKGGGEGGTVSPSAIQYAGQVTLNNSTEVKARIKNGNEWSALCEAAYAVDAVAENLRITEMMYHPGDVNEPSDPNEEYIELTNTGSETINLNLVRFTRGIDFTFPAVDLVPGGRVVVVEERAAFEGRYGTGVDIAGEYSGKLDNGGERIRLEDAVGRSILDFKYKDGWRGITDGAGYSLTMIDSSDPNNSNWGKKDSWRASAYAGGSPGLDDGGIVPNPGAVVINEVLAHSHAAAPDWIELYNTTNEQIDIGGWYLSDSELDLKKYEIAAGTKIKAGEYKLFHEDLHFGELSTDPGCHVPFALSENGDELYLTAAKDGILLGYREHEDFGASETGVSFGRYFKGSTGSFNFVALDSNTPGGTNSYPEVGSIVISEIMYNPDWPYAGSYTNNQYEYIELHNIGGAPVTLYDSNESEPWKFTDGIEFTFPESPDEVTIPGGGYLLVVKNPAAFSWRYPDVSEEKILGPYIGMLSDAGEKLELSKPGDLDEFHDRHYIRVDRVVYSDGSHPEDCPGDVDLWPADADEGGKSLRRIAGDRYGNDPNNWVSDTPSPGQ